IEEENKEAKKWWKYKNLMRIGALGKQWGAGYTVILDKYSVDLTNKVAMLGFPKIIGYKKEINSIERILCSREINNILLVGDPETGQKNIIYKLAERFALGECPVSLNYNRIIQLDMPLLLAGIENIEEVEFTLAAIFEEVSNAGNVVLVINNFHHYIEREIGLGRIDISGILARYLKSPQFRIIATTNYTGLHRYIEQNSLILSLFQKKEISEISPKEALIVLENLIPSIELKYKVFISYPALQEIITDCVKFFPSMRFPKKAIDLLDEVVALVVQNKQKIVLPKDVSKIVSEKTEVPVGKIENKEKEILLNLEKLIHKRIINQEQAVQGISSAMRRARVGVSARNGPMGCFLFLGPTGVGKTETAKTLSDIYFGSEKKMIRLDMSEFQSISDISRLIGSSGEEGLLTAKVRENPFSVILFDEIEKAHPNILNLFLQVLDEGRLTDGLGRKVFFKNSIIIVTSNAGYEIILDALKKKTEWSKVKQKLLDYVFEKRIFRPEFINRFDDVIVFKPLTKENLLGISEIMLQKIKKNLQEKRIEFIITLPLKEKIVELGYSPRFGAREMKRVIQDNIEDAMASAILSGKLKKGDKIKIDAKTFQLIIY
ncbi:MAG: ATP-dependent Clp protease ATP-binding subunit, partial [Patescibacteria group bacterium]|nr:ATP-dependent Clp protease ATP-binding subunit [Patescibacteria group bacterium]